MCLAMCLKNKSSQPDCVYKLGVYKKISVVDFLCPTAHARPCFSRELQ